jgi:hypothetical protein
LAGQWTGPFLRLSYRAGPNSVRAGMAHASLGKAIRLWLKVGRNTTPSPLNVPYDAETGRYAIELWGRPGTAADLRAALDPHDGLGFLEYRNLLSNYKEVDELGRDIPPWSFDACGRKAEGERLEEFMAID